MEVRRRFTTDGANQFDAVKWDIYDIDISGGGKSVFRMPMAEMPDHFSQTARDIMASKYFRLTGIREDLVRVDEKSASGKPVPEWLRRSVPNQNTKNFMTVGEHSAKQVFHRLAGFWTYSGWMYDYFNTEADAKAYYDESIYMLVHQMFAPNTPQFFSAGIWWAYGIEGNSRELWWADPKTGNVSIVENNFEKPGCHACHICSVDDSLFGKDGIYGAIVNEAKAFSIGGGVGANFSRIRSKYEKLSTGIEASGLMSFLQIFDKSAGIIRSGGQMRKAAKMVICDVDHPEIQDFITWKMREEDKIKILNDCGYDFSWGSDDYKSIDGQNGNNSIRIDNEFLDAVSSGSDWNLTARTTGKVVKTIKAKELWDNIIDSIYACGDPGIQFDDTIQRWDTCPDDGRIEASNPCVTGDTIVYTGDGADCRIDSLVGKETQLLTRDGNKNARVFYTGCKETYQLKAVVRPNSSFESQVLLRATPDHMIYTNHGWVAMKDLVKGDMLSCYGDDECVVISVVPTGICEDVYDATVDDVHSFYANGILIHNCAEYLFKSNTSCNLASINLKAFLDDKFKTDDFRYACHHVVVMLDIVNNVAQLPSADLAKGVYDYRAIGIGYTGLGALLMSMGIPYDSDEGRNFAAAITSLMTGEAYLRSAQLAKEFGKFPRFSDKMFETIKMHKDLSLGNQVGESFYIDHSKLEDHLSEAVKTAWNKAFKSGKESGYRNAFVSLIQPSGTLSLIMDCDTTSAEPEYSLVKHKKMIDGMAIKMISDSFTIGLKSLGYKDKEIDDIVMYVLGTGDLDAEVSINRDSLFEAGLTEDDIESIEGRLERAIELRRAITYDALSQDTITKLSIKPDTNIMKHLGFTKDDYLSSNRVICGAGTIEGAPHIKMKHMPIFDCAINSMYGIRFIPWQGHIRMLGAVQPFISGAISKTVNLPHDIDKKTIGEAIKESYKLGVKCVAFYRDGSKSAQPLTTANRDLLWWDPKPALLTFRRGERRRPPMKRIASVQELTIYDNADPTKVIVKFGEYEDGSLAEVWIDVNKKNPDFYLAMKWLSRAISNSVQYGQPLEDLANSYLLDIGGPAGRTDHPYITSCTSIVDLVVRLILTEYCGDTSYCKVTPPAHELRCKKINTKPIVEKQGDKIKQYRMIKTTVGKCPVCGSSNISQFPCPTCSDCGSSLGGCA